MSFTGATICDLVYTPGKSGADIAELLKKVGGDMQGGLQRIAEYFLEEGNLDGFITGKAVGEKQGFIKGSVVSTAIVGSMALVAIKIRDEYYLRKVLAAHKTEGEKILQATKTCEHETNSNGILGGNTENEVDEHDI